MLEKGNNIVSTVLPYSNHKKLNRDMSECDYMYLCV